MKAGSEPKFINYNTIWKHRLDRGGGGLAVLVRQDMTIIPSKSIEFADGNLETQNITVLTNNSRLNILNVYNPRTS